MSFIKKKKPKITIAKGHVNTVSQYKLGGNALKTTYLLQQNNHYNIERSYDYINPRVWALAKGKKWEELVKIIVMHKNIIEPDWVSPSPCNYNCDNALHLAVLGNCLKVIELLITMCHYNPYIKNRSDQTAISIAKSLNHELTIRILNWYKPINVCRKRKQ